MRAQRGRHRMPTTETFCPKCGKKTNNPNHVFECSGKEVNTGDKAMIAIVAVAIVALVGLVAYTMSIKSNSIVNPPSVVETKPSPLSPDPSSSDAGDIVFGDNYEMDSESDKFKIIGPRNEFHSGEKMAIVAQSKKPFKATELEYTIGRVDRDGTLSFVKKGTIPIANPESDSVALRNPLSELVPDEVPGKYTLRYIKNHEETLSVGSFTVEMSATPEPIPTPESSSSKIKELSMDEIKSRLDLCYTKISKSYSEKNIDGIHSYYQKNWIYEDQDGERDTVATSTRYFRNLFAEDNSRRVISCEMSYEIVNIGDLDSRHNVVSRVRYKVHRERLEPGSSAVSQSIEVLQDDTWHVDGTALECIRTKVIEKHKNF